MIKDKQDFTNRFKAATTIKTRIKLIKEAISSGIISVTPMLFEMTGARLKPEVKKEYREKGFFVYDMRDEGGKGFTIEPFVLVNHVGAMICDTPIDFDILGCSERRDTFINDEEFYLLYDAKEVRELKGLRGDEKHE